MKAFKTVKKVLTDVGWEPEETNQEGVLRVDFSVDKIPIVDALADVRIDYERFLYYLNFRDRAPVKQRRQVMEFITRVNYDLVVGNFELNLDNGHVRFKASVDFTNEVLTEALIQDAIQSAMNAVEAYADGVIAVMRGEKEVRQAIKDAEADLDSSN